MRPGFHWCSQRLLALGKPRRSPLANWRGDIALPRLQATPRVRPTLGCTGGAVMPAPPSLARLWRLPGRLSTGTASRRLQ